MLKHFTFLLLVITVFFTSQAQEINHKQGELLVRFLKESDITKTCDDITRTAGTEIKPVRELSDALNVWLCRFDFTRIAERQMLRQVQLNKNVRSAQFNYNIELFETIPDDPKFDQQWQWMNLGMGGMEDVDVDAELAWDYTTGGAMSNGDSIVVAIVGTGTDLNHPDLNDNLWVNKNEIPDNGIDEDENGYVDDYYGWHVPDSSDNVDTDIPHGVSVAGMIGAKGNNGIGITGINWNVKLMTASFTVAPGHIDEGFAALNYVYVQRKLYNQTDGERGANVVAINTSFGLAGVSSGDFPLWCSLYDSLGSEGVLIVGAASNDSTQNLDQLGHFPGGCSSEHLINVTAINNKDVLTGAYGDTLIDIAPPGRNIFTTSPDSAYRETFGTSYAAPIVAGLVGLLYSVDCPELTELPPPEAAGIIRDAIYASVDQTGNLEGYVKYDGRVNAHKAVEYLLTQCDSLTDIHQPVAQSEPIKVYPVPSDDFIWIEGLQTNTPVHIYNIQGEMVDRLKANSNNFKYEIGHLQQGNYWIVTPRRSAKFILVR